MTSLESPPPVFAIDILRRYLEHPTLADSLEGIAEWRLLEDLVQRRVHETGAALHWLVEHDLLECSAETRAVPALYRLNARRRTAAADLVARNAVCERQAGGDHAESLG